MYVCCVCARCSVFGGFARGRMVSLGCGSGCSLHLGSALVSGVDMLLCSLMIAGVSVSAVCVVPYRMPPHDRAHVRLGQTRALMAGLQARLPARWGTTRGVLRNILRLAPRTGAPSAEFRIGAGSLPYFERRVPCPVLALGRPDACPLYFACLESFVVVYCCLHSFAIWAQACLPLGSASAPAALSACGQCFKGSRRHSWWT